jgi:hypothetical protein
MTRAPLSRKSPARSATPSCAARSPRCPPRALRGTTLFVTHRPRSLARALLLLAPLGATACSDATPAADAGADAAVDVPGADATGSPSQSLFDPAADLTDSAHYYDLPYPSDVRLTPQGRPDLRGMPVRGTLVPGIVALAGDRPGWPVIALGYLRFRGTLRPRDPADLIAADDPAAPVMLLDVDPASPERGRRFPVVAATPGEDPYLPESTLAVGARPGVILRAGRRYAFVVRASLGDAQGRPLRADNRFIALRDGATPEGPRGAALAALYRPLWETLPMVGVARDEVVTATVFTTGDVVADTAALGDRVLARHDVQVEGLQLAPGDSPATHPRFCQLNGFVRMPQFQRGVAPYNTDGTFELDAEGTPIRQTVTAPANYDRVPVTFTLPRSAMPAEGYPLVLYLHGSGGLSTQAVDRGTWRPQAPDFPCPPGSEQWEGVTGCNTLGQGPAFLLAPRGFATAAAALPVNPERLPGAAGTAYLNLANLRAFRDTFRQGVLESRLFVEALGAVRIPASLVAQCTGASLPAGATEARYDLSRLIAMGQSMGGMYTNLLAATEPRVRAAIPTGAGGHWGYFILRTQLIPGAAVALRPLLGTTQPLTFLHPALAMLETAWEAAEPIVYTPRIARDPLPGHPVRSIYQPAGQGDSYFPTEVFDAMALAYGHTQAGASVWPTMQPTLALQGHGGIIPYPVRNNRMGGPMSTPYTGVVVQFAGDGVYDPHAIYSQLDAVKYQYGCFAESFQRTGVARVPDPAGRSADAPCGE